MKATQERTESTQVSRWFQFSHCEHPIYIGQYSSSTYIWSIHRSVDPIFQSFWFLSWFPWQRVATNKEAIGPRVPSG